MSIRSRLAASVRGFIRSTGGVLCGSAVACATLLSAPTAALGQARVGFITIEGPLLEREPAASMFFGSSKRLTMRSVVGALKDAAGRDEIEGVVLRLTVPELSATQIDELGQAIAAVRAAGKRVHTFTEIYTTPLLRLASFGDEAIVQSGGGVFVSGMYMESMFLAGSLKNMGMAFDRVMIGDYKGAAEELALSEPSDAYNEMLDVLMDGLYGATTRQLTGGRGMPLAHLEAAMETGFLGDPGFGIEHGLIDAEVDRLALREHLSEAYGQPVRFVTRLGTINDASGPDFASMGFFETFAYFNRLFSGSATTTQPTRDTIAVLHIDGPIMDGKSGSGGLFGGSSVGSITMRQTIKDLQDNDHVRGVVVRIDSPGGSAIASESIWLGLRGLAEHKPVWVSVGDMAASGGYYIAVAGERIYANPHSIVGSIGVVGGKLTMTGLFEMIDANIVSRQRGPGGDLFTSARAWTPRQREVIAESMTKIYGLFLDRVKSGRPDIDPSKAAAGRLFVGEQALGLAMVDRVAGLDSAIEDLASELGLAGGSFDVMDFPRPKSFDELLEGIFPFASAPAAARGLGAQAVSGGLEALFTEALGAQAWSQLRSRLEAMQLFRTQPVGLVCPTVIFVR